MGWTLANANVPFGGRARASVAVFLDQLFVVGGTAAMSSWACQADSWSSANGIDWTNAGTTPFTRAGHSLVVFNQQLVLIGGLDCATQTNQVWATSDGLSWVRQTDPLFSARAFHSTVVFNSSIVVIAGSGDSSDLNDVWAASDLSLPWSNTCAAGAFAARHGAATAVFNGRIFLQGGAGNLSDMWVSANDGVSWTQVAGTPFPGMEGPSMVVFNGRLYLMGGDTGVPLATIWASNDGNAWFTTTSQLPTLRALFTVIPFRGGLWMGTGTDAAWNTGTLPTDSYFIGIFSHCCRILFSALFFLLRQTITAHIYSGLCGSSASRMVMAARHLLHL